MVSIDEITKLLNANIGGNSGSTYILWLFVFLVALIFLKLFKSYFLTKYRSARGITHEFEGFLIGFVDEIHWPFYTFVSFYIASQFIALPPDVDRILDYMMIIFFTFYLLLGVNKLINYITQRKIQSLLLTQRQSNVAIIRLFNKAAKLSVWIFAIILLFSNLGLNVTSLIAGLGITGVAIAFALQRILEDVFSSFSIYFDKPFEEGDFIMVGEDIGMVKQVGLKTTRLQTIQGDELVISNKEITSVRVHNFKKMEKRRIIFTLSVEYGTSNKKLKKAKEIIRDIIMKTQKAELDRVHFKSFGDSSLIFEVRYYVDTNDYNLYMDTQEHINLAIKEAFEKEKINFAFPTRTLHIKK